MPKSLYDEARKQAKKYHYTSVSELIRDALRWWMSDNLTVNGFTPEFEKEVLEAEKEADKGNVIEWDGKGSFTKFVLREGSKRYDKNTSSRKVLQKSQNTDRRGSRVGEGDRAAGAVV